MHYHCNREAFRECTILEVLTSRASGSPHTPLMPMAIFAPPKMRTLETRPTVPHPLSRSNKRRISICHVVGVYSRTRCSIGASHRNAPIQSLNALAFVRRHPRLPSFSSPHILHLSFVLRGICLTCLFSVLSLLSGSERKG